MQLLLVMKADIQEISALCRKRSAVRAVYQTLLVKNFKVLANSDV